MGRISTGTWIGIAAVGAVGLGVGAYIVIASTRSKNNVPRSLQGQRVFASGTAVMTRPIATTAGTFSLGGGNTLRVSAGDPVEFHGVSIGADGDQDWAEKHFLVVWTLIKDKEGNIFQRSLAGEGSTPVVQLLGDAKRIKSSDPAYKLNPTVYNQLSSANKELLPASVPLGRNTAVVSDPAVAATTPWWVTTSISAKKLYQSNMAGLASSQIAISVHDPNMFRD